MSIMHYTECQCSSADHVLRWIWDGEDLWVEVQLSPKPFHQRVWGGLKYIFGYNCEYGHWDITLIKKADKQALINLLKESMEHEA